MSERLPRKHHKGSRNVQQLTIVSAEPPTTVIMETPYHLLEWKTGKADGAEFGPGRGTVETADFVGGKFNGSAAL